MLTLKNTDETNEVNIVQENSADTNENAEPDTNVNQEDTNSTSDPEINPDDVVEDVSIEEINEPVIDTQPEEIIDYAALRAAKRAQRIADFNATAIKREEELKQLKFKMRLKELSEEEKEKFLQEEARIRRENQNRKDRENFRNKRLDMINARNELIQSQIDNSINYQKKLEEERIAREEALRIRQEAEIQAAESIRFAEEARRKAIEIDEEALRFEDEARRRIVIAETISKSKKNK